MKQMIIETKYRMKKILLNKVSIKDFFVDEAGRRQIRNGQVKVIANHLRTGGHFSSPLVVNKLNKMKFIDGNHRYEAIRLMIDENPKFEINCWIAIYSDLNLEEERDVYREWNVGLKQSATDFLKAHWDSIPMKVRLLKDLPVSIYGDKKHLPMKSFVGNQIMAKLEREHFEGGYAGGIYQVVSDFQKLIDEDIDTLVEFSEFIENVLGKFESKIVKYYTTTAMSSIYRIWYDNRHLISDKRMRLAFSRILNKTDDLLVDASKAGGRGATLNFYSGLLYRLNKGAMKFLNDIEIYQIRQDEEKDRESRLKLINLVKQ